MNDLISRQALCDDLREYKVHPVPISSDESEVKGYNDGIDLAISVIAEFPSVEPERKSMIWKPAKGRPAYEKGICNCGYVLSVLQRDFVYCPMCGSKLEWSER